MEIKIRNATAADNNLIGWVSHTASKGSGLRCWWDVMTLRSESFCCEWLAKMALIDELSWQHYASFLVAEADGRAGAALCGYDPAINTFAHLNEAIGTSAREMKMTDDEIEAMGPRFRPLMTCVHSYEPRVWVVENVATRPEFRRNGLVDALLQKILARGRERGHPVAQLSVLIGNDSAIRAYEKVGFKIAAEKRHPDFEVAVGAPGLLKMVCDLR